MTALLVTLVLLPALAGLLPLPAWLALRRARQEGVTLRGFSALREARRIDTVVLDRWGTVTTGELAVSAVSPVEEGNERNLRWFAAALAHAAEGPVAQAIARLAAPGHLSGVESFAGDGVSGAVDRHPVRVGRPGWLGMEERPGIGETVGVEVDHRPFGYLTVTDQVRADAALAVTRLRAAGITPILLSDGDALTTEHIAQSCGIDKWLRGDDPDQREQLVRDQRGAGHTVALVARSAGNTAALAAADVAFTDTPAEDSDAGADADAGSVPHARLVDLDARRVAHALELARALPTIALRTRVTGLLGLAAGVALAAVGRLDAVTGVICALAGCVAVVLVALSSLARRG